VSEARLARQFLLERIADFELPNAHRGFVIHHDCGSIRFLVASFWRDNNELWERVYLRQRDESAFDLMEPMNGFQHSHCVWQLPIVWHETKAWIRYLQSSRMPLDREIWLADACEINACNRMKGGSEWG
jgi:hypothetical protein